VTAPLATLRDVGVRLGGRDILDGVNTNLRRREVTALIGMNGAGKTTLLRALLGEVPYRGEIRFDCVHGNRQQPGHIGYVPQRLTIEGNLPLTVYDLCGLSLQRWPWFLSSGKAFRSRIKVMLAGVGVERLIDSEVRVLSGGELQRVLLALALEPTPELLLLDEPAAGIDFQMQEDFYKLIGRLHQERGVTVLLVSHDLTMVSKVVGHVWCMKDGRIECEGSPHDMMNSDALKRIFGSHQGVFAHRH
jgi:zinc transport system ATP-binding protein